MNLLHTYLQQPRVRTTLKRSPGEQGFSLIELVVVIAVLAVLTAIALPNFLGVTEDASARTAQQGALNAYKECKVFWARNKRDNTREFNQPSITDWVILAQDSVPGGGEGFVTAEKKKATDQSKQDLVCFTAAGAERDVFAVPTDTTKFPIYKINVAGDRRCKNGTTTGTDTFDVGCGATGTGIGEWQ